MIKRLSRFIEKSNLLRTVLAAMACMVIFSSCRKDPPPQHEGEVTHQPADSIVGLFFTNMQASEESRALVRRLEASYGSTRWADALARSADGGSICILPMAFADADTISALLLMEIRQGLRVRVVAAGEYPINAIASTRSAMGRLIHFTNYRIFGRQLLSGHGLRFGGGLDSIPSRLPDGARKAHMAVSVCYSYYACTGDGMGNCVGNYTFHDECYTSTYWFDDYSYMDLPLYGGDPDSNPNPGYGGGSSSGAGNSALPPPLKKIENLEVYLCFDPTRPAILTVYVDQPLPGADDPFTILGKMGHAFISIEQTGAAGTSRRFLGFYPQTAVNPFGKTSAPATIGNDEEKKHDLRLAIPLNPGQLQSVLAAIKNHKAEYDLEDYNCTDFCMDVAQAAGVIIPRNSGWWIFGRGHHPGRMGEDMRNMPGVITKGGRAMKNDGSCQ